jgi:hypothetical protein
LEENKDDLLETDRWTRTIFQSLATILLVVGLGGSKPSSGRNPERVPKE